MKATFPIFKIRPTKNANILEFEAQNYNGLKFYMFKPDAEYFRKQIGLALGKFEEINNAK